MPKRHNTCPWHYEQQAVLIFCLAASSLWMDSARQDIKILHWTPPQVCRSVYHMSSHETRSPRPSAAVVDHTNTGGGNGLGTRLQLTSHLCSITLWNAHDIVAGFNLLGHERLCGGEENDLPTGVPAIEVVHHHSCNERLPQAGREADKSVPEECLLDDVELIVSDRVVSRVDRQPPCFPIKTRNVLYD